MARTAGPAISRSDDTPEMFELMSPFFRTTELEGKLTPYKVAVLVLLEQYITFETPDDFTPAEKRRIAIGFMNLFRSTSRPLKDLKRFIFVEFDSEIMRNIFRTFAKRALAMDVDLFLSMFYGCIATFVCSDAKPLVKPTSLAGQFVRKLYISYKKASFSEMCRLWAEFRRYFNDGLSPTLTNVEGMDVENGVGDQSASSAGGESLQNMAMEFGKGGRMESVGCDVIPNQKGILAFILRQVYLLEHKPAFAASYSSVGRWLREMSRHIPDSHEICFLEYLNEMRIKNFPAAQSALHRYFDCIGLAMMSKNVFEFSSLNRLTGPATITIPMNAFRSLRYGPLLLADMHRRFGNEDKALAYLQECIKNAEEANDKVCLDYAVAMFSMLNYATKRSDYDRLMENVLKDTEDRNASFLHLRCHLAQLLKGVANCGTPKSIVDIAHLVYAEIQEKIPAAASVSKHHGTHKTERSIKNVLQALMSSAFLQRGYWDAACLEAQKLVCSVSIMTADVHCVGIANLAYALAAKGQYDNAKKLLSDSRKEVSLYSTEFNRLNLADALIGFETAFLIGDDDECRRNLFIALPLSPVEAALRWAMYNAARDTYLDAISSLTKLLCSYEGQNPYIRARTLLILGQLSLHRVGNAGKAQEYFVQCQKLAADHRLKQLKLTAGFEIMETEAVLGVLSSPAFEDHAKQPFEETWFLGVLHSACVGLSKARTLLKRKLERSGNGSGGGSSKIYATEAITILEDALRKLDSINAKIYQRQAYALLAVAYDRLGNDEKRNRMSKFYRQLHDRLKKSGFTAIMF